ncbi:hypothetical protein [Halomonas sp. PGE1]|nr:hypothetical protein [Halomonas sp. PGE1]
MNFEKVVQTSQRQYVHKIIDGNGVYGGERAARRIVKKFVECAR